MPTRKQHVRQPQEAVIAAVRERGGVASLQQVADALDIHLGTAERKLEGYVFQGVLIREDYSDDGRALLARPDRRYGLAGDEPLACTG